MTAPNDPSGRFKKVSEAIEAILAAYLTTLQQVAEGGDLDHGLDLIVGFFATYEKPDALGVSATQPHKRSLAVLRFKIDEPYETVDSLLAFLCDSLKKSNAIDATSLAGHIIDDDVTRLELTVGIVSGQLLAANEALNRNR